ncbi:MAG: sigma-70 family polymerase sigma factor [Thermoleophilia bacterium]|nr:sigma-70 family polymerase sigma factor [Thermoleophilia bacterium]
MDDTTSPTAIDAPPVPGSAPRDHDAWLRGLIDGHADALRRFAASQVGPDVADDVLSAVFTDAWRMRSAYRAELGTLRAWLVGLAFNRCRVERRALRRWTRRARSGDIDLSGDPVDDAEARIDAARDRAQLLAAIAQLPIRQREALLLVAVAELDPIEVADVLGVPAATVRSNLHRARRALAPQLEERR